MLAWARAILLGITIAAGGQVLPGRAGEVRLNTCLSPGETREAIETRKMVPPFRAMVEAARGGAGESIGIKLCRYNALMVYEVILLRHDGRLVYLLVDASNGVLLPR